MKALIIAASLALPVVASAEDQVKTQKNQVRETTTAAGAESGYSDAKVVNKLHHISSMNVELGTLAQTRGGNDKLRNFGSKLIREHQKLDGQVSAFAKDKGLTLDEFAIAPNAIEGSDPAERTGTTGANDDLYAPGSPGGVSATNRSGSQMGTQTPNSYSQPGTGGPGSGYEKSGSGRTATNDYGNTPPATRAEKNAEAPSNDQSGVNNPSLSTGMANADRQQQAKERKEAKLDRLRNLQGTEFDSQFLSDVIDGSQKAIDRLQGWRGASSDKKLDSLIDQSVKTLQGDIKDAQKLQQHTPAA
ncbi:MAG: DUF4142 domain-containing protein [Archangiaceae bacterium]|nr:DUF4142 domain-containing protein [Archangiaceae bacterium]